MTGPESEAGITYQELNILIGSGAAGNVKVRCPECGGDARHKNKRDLSVNLDTGELRCHNPGCVWESGTGLKSLARSRSNGASTPPSPRRESSGRNIPHRYMRGANPTHAEGRKPLPSSLPQWGLDWFLDQRGIPPEMAKAMDVRGADNTLYFPYYLDGTHVNTKMRRLPKQFWMEKESDGAVMIPYNMDAVTLSDTILMVEGELDVFACKLAGWPYVISVPNGADSDLDKVFKHPRVAATLENATNLVLAVDSDEPGQKLQAKLIEMFGAVRCWTVAWPEGYKDANEVLVKLGVKELDRIIGDAKPVDLPGIHTFDGDWDALQSIWSKGYDRGLSTGWAEFDKYYRVKEGQLITVYGIPSHGKSSFLIDMFLRLANQHGWKFGLFTPETGNNGDLLAKMVQNVMDKPILPGSANHMSEDELRAGWKWVCERFWRCDAVHYTGDQYATLTIYEVLNRLENLVLREGIKGAIIDPWNRMDSMRPKHLSETEYIASALSAISRFCHRHKVTVFVVHHPTKQDTGRDGEDEDMPTPYAIAGSAHWYGMSDVIMGVQRNKYTDNITTVRIWKHREEGISGSLGQVKFTYEPATRRYACADEPMNIRRSRGDEAYARVQEFDVA